MSPKEIDVGRVLLVLIDSSISSVRMRNKSLYPGTLLGYCKESRCHIKLFGYFTIFFISNIKTSRDTTKLGILKLGILNVGIMNFGCFETGLFGVWAS
jgi:hypothetical protein